MSSVKRKNVSVVNNWIRITRIKYKIFYRNSLKEIGLPGEAWRMFFYFGNNRLRANAFPEGVFKYASNFFASSGFLKAI